MLADSDIQLVHGKHMVTLFGLILVAQKLANVVTCGLFFSHLCYCASFVQVGGILAQVNYRESISRPADVRYVHKKQSGGSGQFADVAIRFEPSEAGEGFVFKSEVKGGSVPKEYIPGVVKVSSMLACLLD